MAVAFVFFRGATASGALYLLEHIRLGIGIVSREFSALMDSQGRAILIGCAGYLIMEAGDYLRRRVNHGESLGALAPWPRWTAYYLTTVLAIVMMLLMFGIQMNRTTFVYVMF
jgi:hypothetical protein